jgi:hypothetical protein
MLVDHIVIRHSALKCRSVSQPSQKIVFLVVWVEIFSTVPHSTPLTVVPVLCLLLVSKASAVLLSTLFVATASSPESGSACCCRFGALWSASFPISAVVPQSLRPCPHSQSTIHQEINNVEE